MNSRFGHRRPDRPRAVCKHQLSRKEWRGMSMNLQNVAGGHVTDLQCRGRPKQRPVVEQSDVAIYFVQRAPPNRGRAASHHEARPVPSRSAVVAAVVGGMESRVVFGSFLGPFGVVGPNEELAVVIQFSHKLPAFGVFVEGHR